MTNDELLKTLVDNFMSLEPDAKEVLVILSQRLIKGHDTYGGMDVSGDGRDYLFEMGEELADTAVYWAMEFLKRQRKPKVCSVCHMPGCQKVASR